MIGYEVIRMTDEWEQTVIIKFTILGKQKTKQSDDSQLQGDSSNMSLDHTTNLPFRPGQNMGWLVLIRKIRLDLLWCYQLR